MPRGRKIKISREDIIDADKNSIGEPADLTGISTGIEDTEVKRYQISATASFSITDSEPWPWSDVHLEITKPVQSKILSIADGVSQTLFDWTVGMGGEIRVVLNITGQIANTNGTLRYQINGYLYEGTTEHSDDLDDESHTGDCLLNCNNTTSHTINLLNTEPGGGDTALINLQISNQLIP
jgi:hypothetical protein